MTAVPLSGIEPLRLLLSHRPLGLFSDIDGTLAPIVARPEDARVTERCRELLGRLVDCGVRVALITGRTPEMARRMTGVEGLAYAANHGMSLWIDGVDETPEAVGSYTARASELAQDLAAIDVAGVTVEHTGPNVAVHYRRAPDEAAARARIIQAIEASSAARSFRLEEGRKVFELRPPLPINKGSALIDLAARLGVTSALCLGDDRTDVDMFVAVHRLRDGGLPGLAVAVKSEETAPAVLMNADYAVDGVEGVEWLLGALLTAVGETSP